LFLLGSFGFTLTLNRHQKFLNKNPFTMAEKAKTFQIFVYLFGDNILAKLPWAAWHLCRYSASRTEDRGFESPPGCKEVLNCNSVIS
jgi:hypothetical protein